jgi:glycosyltransferase involved in cell wall biosynthesis
MSDSGLMVSDAPALSIVVPLYNEEESIGLLYEKIRDACDGIDCTYEILFVDDGSSDTTSDLVLELRRGDGRVRALRMRRNAGQTAAMAAGFDAARGATIVSMDGDLQNDPSDIPALLAKMAQGYDIVCGWRKNRQDKLISRRVPSVIANWLIGRITGVSIHDNGCSLKAYRASTIKAVSLYGEMHRFIPAMSTMAGARIAEIEVHHHARQFGTSKYGIGRAWRVALDIVTIKMITGFASRPVLWFGLLSLPVLLAASGALAVASLALFGEAPERGLVNSTVSFLLFFLAAHLISFGVIGELVMHTGSYSPQTMALPSVESLEVRDG